MKRNFITWDEFMEQNVLTSPENITRYLDASLEEFKYDHNIEALMLDVQRVAKLQGSISSLAQKASVSRQNLYKIFNHKIIPRFDTVMKILEALGYDISITRKTA